MIEFYSVMESVLRDAQLLNELKQMHEHIHEKHKPVQEWIDEMEKQYLNVTGVVHDAFEYQFVSADAFFYHFLLDWLFSTAKRRSYLKTGGKRYSAV
ncbi:MAG: hypothetical protein U5R06_14835 [candidate division KSB1 bacterium]|nr:hypothetical protein [candidate division KSB1 bacterium]